MSPDAKEALILASNKSVYDLGVLDKTGNAIQIFYQNKSLATDESDTPNNEHLLVSILPIDQQRSFLQIDVMTQTDEGEKESLRIERKIKEFYRSGNKLEADGNKFVILPQEPDGAFKSGGFWKQPITIQLKHERCA